jgi:hypothetical protein
MKRLTSNRYTRGILKYRKIWLPVTSAGGVLFFLFCDYASYPDAAIAFTFVWLYYAIFLITNYTSVSVYRDGNGDLIITDKKDADNNDTNTKNENSHENIKTNR